MRKFALYLGVTILSLCGGCDSNDVPADIQQTAEYVESAHAIANPQVNSMASAGATVGSMFDESITKLPCALLTAEAVATVAGVTVEALQQQHIAQMCMYSWAHGSAALVSLRTDSDLDMARMGFEYSYRNQTPEEVKESIDALGAEAQRKVAAGEIDVRPEHVKTLTSAVTENLSQGLQYEDVPDLGDAASLEITQTKTEFEGKMFLSYPNLLAVLVGNLHYSVSFSRDGEPQIYREETRALARAVLEQLPQ
jgi:hypothetical protein